MRKGHLVLALLSCLGLAHADVAPVSKQEAAAWSDHLVPLPKEISIAAKVLLAPKDIAIRLRSEPGDIEKQAAADLNDLFQRKAGLAPNGAAFQILLGVLDENDRLCDVPIEDAAKLKGLPCKEQAYVIQPNGQDKLIVAALDPKGVYHGAQTLIQLLDPFLSKDQATVPLASILDWPDMDERGLWNFDLDLIPWITSLKMNFAKVPSPPERIKKGQPVRSRPRSTKRFPNVLEAGAVRALDAVPNVAHLNYIGKQHGAYEAWPETAGKGDKAIPTIWYKPRQIRVPCATCPLWKKIIAEYMADLASKGAQEISVWLSEFEAQCQCEPCLKAGQLRTETRAACEAWREAQKQYPHLVLRIFYCMGGKSEEDTYACLMELPPEVKIERCYGTYGKAFDKAAAEGRWLASYSGPPLTRGELSGMRFYGGSRTKDYIRNLHDRKWRGVYSINYVYSTGAYQRELFSFHVNALAEWTWNLNGRSVKDLARAWATRTGYAQPGKVAEWVELMDPVERACEAPLRSREWAKVPEAIKAREAPRFGYGVLDGIRSAKALDDYLSACEKALSIAKDTAAEELVLETQYVAAFVRALKLVHEMETAASAKATASALEPKVKEFREATAEMVSLFDRKTGLLKSEPKSFAEKIKKIHTDLWRERTDSIASAVAERK